MKNPLLIQFELHHRLFNNVLEGFTDSETNQRLHNCEQINHVKYIAGHLLNSHYGLATMVGMDWDIKWNELFAVMGKSEAKDNFSYPPIEDISAEWNQLNSMLLDKLEGITSETLEAQPSVPFDRVAGSNNEFWAFINHHVAYHIGQIGILRRGFGKKPMHYD